MAKWEYDDGGREAAGYKGGTSDCVVRAFAIASGRPYQEVYDLVKGLARGERRGNRKRGRSSPRTGVYKQTTRRLAERLGMTWTPTMQIGSGCKVHLSADELPSGRLVASCSRHVVAVIDGVVRDVYDPARDGRRCVYGYWTFRPSAL
jgi:hypothetical protein